jgi:hypothetical protein
MVRVMLDKVVQHQLHGEGMPSIATALGRRDIIADHPFDPGHAVGTMNEIVPQLGSDDRGQMLMLRNGRHFLVRQITHGNAIFQRQHQSHSEPSADDEQNSLCRFGHRRLDIDQSPWGIAAAGLW